MRPLTRQQQWRRKNPKRYLAHLYTQAARRMGVLKQQPCEHCGAEKTEAHHPDYDMPGLVQWLCRRCHNRVHARGAQ